MHRSNVFPKGTGKERGEEAESGRRESNFYVSRKDGGIATGG